MSRARRRDRGRPASRRGNLRDRCQRRPRHGGRRRGGSDGRRDRWRARADRRGRTDHRRSGGLSDVALGLGRRRCGGGRARCRRLGRRHRARTRERRRGLPRTGRACGGGGGRGRSERCWRCWRRDRRWRRGRAVLWRVRFAVSPAGLGAGLGGLGDAHALSGLDGDGGGAPAVLVAVSLGVCLGGAGGFARASRGSDEPFTDRRLQAGGNRRHVVVHVRNPLGPAPVQDRLGGDVEFFRDLEDSLGQCPLRRPPSFGVCRGSPMCCRGSWVGVSRRCPRGSWRSARCPAWRPGRCREGCCPRGRCPPRCDRGSGCRT